MLEHHFRSTAFIRSSKPDVFADTPSHAHALEGSESDVFPVEVQFQRIGESQVGNRIRGEVAESVESVQVAGLDRWTVIYLPTVGTNVCIWLFMRIHDVENSIPPKVATRYDESGPSTISHVGFYEGISIRFAEVVRGLRKAADENRYKIFSEHDQFRYKATKTVRV